jgi:hypothetical protein
VHVHPIKPTLKAPGTKRLNLKSYELLSKFAFNFYLRCYTKAAARVERQRADHFAKELGRAVQVDSMKPKLKPPGRWN